MKVLGIVVEYNPFHNGHIYHIQKAKQIVKPDYTIAVMSSSFVQRGEPAIIDKWTRSHLAIEFGVDLVIELPFVYSCQSADYFAKGAIDLLHAIGITDLCFGSEDGHIETFIDIANAIHAHQELYDCYVKKAMKEGLRYPDACNQALIQIMHKEVRTPNDLLGLSYVKEIISHHYQSLPIALNVPMIIMILTYNKSPSATSIRQAIAKHQDYQEALPHPELYQNECYFLKDYFPYLKYRLLTTTKEELKHIHLVDEGLENTMLHAITYSHSMEEFINHLLSKRYTLPRIQRMIIHVLMNNQKDEIKQAMNIDYLRILAMNDQGRHYLSSIKKHVPIRLLLIFQSFLTLL